MLNALIQLVRDSFIGGQWGRLTFEARGLVTFAVVVAVALVLMLKLL